MLNKVAFLLLGFVCLLIEIQSVEAVRNECPLETYGNWTRLTDDCDCNCSCHPGNDPIHGRPESNSNKCQNKT